MENKPVNIKKILFYFLMIIPLAAVTFLLLSRAGGEIEMLAIPPDMEVTKLREILENPAAYDGKRVLLEGLVGPGCLTCPGDFPYQEGVHSIQMLTEGFRRPRLRRGQPIRVYAEVKARKERVIISALAMEVVR
jgi:hypothetical protein